MNDIEQWKTIPSLPDTIFCACGCGVSFERYDTGGRPRSFVTGHNYAVDDRGRYVPRKKGGEGRAG